MTPLLLTLLLLGLSTVTTAAPPDLLGGQEAAAAFAAAAAASPSAAAAATGSTDPSLITDWQQAFLRDRDLKYSVSANKLLYACSGLIHDHDDVAEGTTVDATADNAFFNSTLNAPSIPGDPSSFAFPNEFDPATTDAFKLHSRPTSTKKIVLDFTGHTLRAGTSWSNLNNFGSTAAIITPPWSLDSDPAFSATELRAIVSIWRNVAEDYSNWDVDVTTEEPPGTDDQADASLVGVGTRVAIGQNNGWFDPSGGVAFVNGFGKSSTGPVAYVFNPSPLGVARAVSHEVGHTVGLGHHGTVAHDGLPAEEYYEGHNEWGELFLRGARLTTTTKQTNKKLTPRFFSGLSPPPEQTTKQNRPHHGRGLLRQRRAVVQGRLPLRQQPFAGRHWDYFNQADASGVFGRGGEQQRRHCLDAPHRQRPHHFRCWSDERQHRAARVQV
jgi:hypothetical protein